MKQLSSYIPRLTDNKLNFKLPNCFYTLSSILKLIVEVSGLIISTKHLNNYKTLRRPKAFC